VAFRVLVRYSESSKAITGSFAPAFMLMMTTALTATFSMTASQAGRS